MSGCGFTLKGLPHKSLCQSVTNNGDQCKNFCKANSFFCFHHCKSELAKKIDRFYQCCNDNYYTTIPAYDPCTREFLYEKARLWATKPGEFFKEYCKKVMPHSAISRALHYRAEMQSFNCLNNCAKTIQSAEECNKKICEQNTSVTKNNTFVTKNNTFVTKNNKRKLEDYVENYFLEQLYVQKKMRTSYHIQIA